MPSTVIFGVMGFSLYSCIEDSLSGVSPLKTLWLTVLSATNELQYGVILWKQLFYLAEKRNDFSTFC